MKGEDCQHDMQPVPTNETLKAEIGEAVRRKCAKCGCVEDDAT